MAARAAKRRKKGAGIEEEERGHFVRSQPFASQVGRLVPQPRRAALRGRSPLPWEPRAFRLKGKRLAVKDSALHYRASSLRMFIPQSPRF